MNTLQMTRLYVTSVMNAMMCVDAPAIEKAIEILRVIRKNGNTAWIVGNGGSAATASHLANDLLKMCSVIAFAIPDMTPTTLAYGNDEGWKYMFHDPISKLYKTGDALIAISCSGNSENVVKCTEFIHSPVIVLTGNNPDCKLAHIQPDVILYSESDDITIQESIHSMICHAIARVLSGSV